MIRSRYLFVSLVLLAVGAGAVAWWRDPSRADIAPPPGSPGTVTIAGGTGASLPPASPEEQGLVAEALATATATAREQGALALGIARRGHAVHVWSALGDDALVRSALLSRLLLVAGEASGTVPPAAGSAEAWASNLSLEVWRPLDAREAVVQLDDDGGLRLPCCVWLRPRDALALAVELLGNRRHLTDAAAATRLLHQMEDGIAPRGDEPFGARAARVWRDHEGTRLYSFPAQDLVILLVRADEARLEDETLLAHQVLRGIVDRQPTPDPAPTPRDLVPAH
jgi:hypothetical protein